MPWHLIPIGKMRPVRRSVLREILRRGACPVSTPAKSASQRTRIRINRLGILLIVGKNREKVTFRRSAQGNLARHVASSESSRSSPHDGTLLFDSGLSNSQRVGTRPSVKFVGQSHSQGLKACLFLGLISGQGLGRGSCPWLPAWRAWKGRRFEKMGERRRWGAMCRIHRMAE